MITWYQDHLVVSNKNSCLVQLLPSNIKLDSLDFKNIELTVEVFADSRIIVKVPVLLPATAYVAEVKPATDPTVTVGELQGNNLEEKFLPVEEALMPPWFDDMYRNGSITVSQDVIDTNKATIDDSTGIGSLYRRWFGCSSIVDEMEYNSQSLYNTITIEEAVHDIIETYSRLENGLPFDTYGYTWRNIATMRDMLLPSDKEMTDALETTGGYHARSTGDYGELEGLGLVGIEHQGGIASVHKVTIPALSKADKEKGVILDPRKERRNRVLNYKKSIQSRGNRG